MNKLLRKLNCLFGNHKWTCDAEQGIKPTKGCSFWDYVTMYCFYCRKISALSSKKKV